MAYAYFQNQAALDAYHNAVCADLGIPKAGRTQSTQEPAVLNQWTDAWINPIQIRSGGNVTTWAAQIPDSHVTLYDAVLGIVVSDSQVVFSADHRTVTITGVAPQPQTYTLDPVTITWRKTKPPTVVMDGKTYDTATGAVLSTTTTTTVVVQGQGKDK